MNDEDIVRDFIQRRMPFPPETGTVALVALHNLVAERDAWEAALHRWGRHERDCTALNPGGSCSCGLTPFAYPKDSDDDYLRDREDKLRAEAKEAHIAERESETT